MVGELKISSLENYIEYVKPFRACLQIVPSKLILKNNFTSLFLLTFYIN